MNLTISPVQRRKLTLVDLTAPPPRSEPIEQPQPQREERQHLRNLVKEYDLTNIAGLSDDYLAAVVSAIAGDIEMITAQLAAYAAGEWPRTEAWRKRAWACRNYKTSDLRLAQAEQERRRRPSQVPVAAAQAFVAAAGQVLSAQQLAAVWERAARLFPGVATGEAR